MRKLIILFLSVILMMGILAGCKKVIDQLAEPEKGEIVAEIIVRDYGSIYVKFFADSAPKAVENFTTHAKEGYYDGLTFNKIIEDSMVFGGDPSGTGSGGESIWGEAFNDEFNDNLQPLRGALCMANAGADTNGSQFLLVQSGQTYNAEVLSQIEEQYGIKFNDKAKELYGTIGGTPWLFRLHTVFGQVYDGYDVLDAITKVEKTNEETGVPAVDVIIDTIKITEY